MLKLLNQSVVRLLVVAIFMLCAPLSLKAQSIEETKALAEQGDAKAQLMMGIYYCEGREVDKNLEEAAKWWGLAAEQGNASAQFNLGVCYDNGSGVTQSYAEAAKWYRLAAEQGEVRAQYNLGIC